MSPRKPTPDPLDVARALLDEARSARGDWRKAFLENARSQIELARAGLDDAEAALRQYAHSPVAARMREGVEKRRRAVENLVGQLKLLDGQTT